MACSVSFHSARDDFGSAMNFSLPADMEFGKMMPTPLSPRSSRVQMLKLRFAPLISKAQKILAGKEEAPASSTLIVEDGKRKPATDDDLRRITNTKKKAAASSSSSLTMVDGKRKKLSSEGVDDERIVGSSPKKRRIDLRVVEFKSKTAAGNATTALLPSPKTTTATTTGPSPAAVADKRRKIQLQRRREAERRERNQMRNTTGIYDPSDLVRDLEKTLGYSITHSHNSTPLPRNLPAFLWSDLAEPREEEEEEEDQDSCSHSSDDVADCVEVSGEREEGEIWDDDR